MITVVNYGAGNLRSVQNTLAELGASYVVTDQPAVAEAASKVILPGVGHFGQMVQGLDSLNLRATLLKKIRASTPFLGICVGLQYLFESSEESPGSRGLGILQGEVKRFTGPVRVPHMGWNSLDSIKSSRLLSGVGDEPYAYFAHSFFAPVVEATAAICTYVQPYSALIETDNLFAVQFHPEKSGPIGLRVLKNFIEL